MKTRPRKEPSVWYARGQPPWPLRVLAALFGWIARRRRQRQTAWARDHKLPVPVVVIGNINVGGTGKTPFVIWLAQRLKEWGWKPGVITRGYGGRARSWPQRVTPESDPDLVGDEAVLIARLAGCPVAVAPDRRAAGLMLTGAGEADILVSDDGLQHYKLWRDLEIAVVDATRGFGNGYVLPAGPLREPVERLQEVALVVVNGDRRNVPRDRAVDMRLFSLEARPLAGGEPRPLAAFEGQTVHAVAGLGNPARFFAGLTQRGIKLVMHPFPDHYPFKRADLQFGDDLPVLMTEKDAVKCRAFAEPRLWAVPAEASISAADAARVQELIARLKPAPDVANPPQPPPITSH